MQRGVDAADHLVDVVDAAAQVRIVHRRRRRRRCGRVAGAARSRRCSGRCGSGRPGPAAVPGRRAATRAGRGTRRLPAPARHAGARAARASRRARRRSRRAGVRVRPPPRRPGCVLRERPARAASAPGHGRARCRAMRRDRAAARCTHQPPSSKRRSNSADDRGRRFGFVVAVHAQHRPACPGRRRAASRP